MKQDELIRKLSTDAEVPKSDVKKVLAILPEFINELVMKQGEEITITGLCKFSKKVKPPRSARNPKTGQTITTQTKTVLSIRPSASFRG